jgi:UDP-N-acetylglucosamine--N-acetylmuramyl-(pentapeptide) pyrophosphoryl-undecaprenol N-acetylglucosamine transferase
MDLCFKDALVITGGGTGGHYYPAIALAEAAAERMPDRQIIFIGARKGIEAMKLPETKWQHLLLDVEGLSLGSPIKAFHAIRRMVESRHYLLRVWETERPFAVVGTGGYAAGPALFAAKKLKVPYFIHESNAEPGLITKLAAKKAVRVWLGMEGAKVRLPKANCLYVGTPIREAFLRPFKPVSTLGPPFRLLALGGSGGAKAINDALFSIAPALLDAHADWEIMHQAGNREMERLRQAQHHQRHSVEPFLENMDEEMERSSLIISRAGASTCAELKAAGRPAVLVPFPASAGGHQKFNASAFVQEGRGAMVEQGQGFEDMLFRALNGLMADEASRLAFSKPEKNTAVANCLADMSEALGQA